MARRVKPITTLGRLRALTPKQRKTYARTLHARRLMQNAGLSRERAAREAGTTPEAMGRYLGGAIKRRGGRWKVRPGARLFSYVWVPTTSGMQRLEASSREADLARRYHDALWRYLNLGDDADLTKLEGSSIAGYTLETDPALLEEMIEGGELDLYEIGSGETGR